MPVPDYQTLMAPALNALTDGTPRSSNDLRMIVAKELGLSEEDLQERISSGANLFANRLHWATTYMAQAGLVRRPRRGVLEITDRGSQALREYAGRIDNEVLSRFPEFRDFKARARASQTGPRNNRPSHALTNAGAVTPTQTPIEAIEVAVEEANATVASQLLERIIQQEPDFLEQLVLQLLVSMGYGGGRGRSQHLGRSGDEGLDGVVRQDALGLESIYVQAKRYAQDRPISRPEIQAFVGALHGAQADKGVFITTSRFTSEAQDYAERVNARVILLDGEQLTSLMVRYNVGVQDADTFVLKRIDEDFFSDL